MTQIHLDEDLMEPRTMFGRLPRGRLVVVDDQDALEGPPQLDRIATQVVLERRRFAMMEDLLRAGLSHRDDGPSLEVVRLDLGRTGQAGAIRVRIDRRSRVRCGVGATAGWARFSEAHACPPAVPAVAGLEPGCDPGPGSPAAAGRVTGESNGVA